MAKILITGSTGGLGLHAAKILMDEGHEVACHARTPERAEAMGDAARTAHAVVTGDLGVRAEVEDLARQVNGLGRMDAVIHNAGIYDSEQHNTEEGYPLTLAVNVVAPYLLSHMIDRPARLIYLGSNLHQGHGDALEDVDWSTRAFAPGTAYGESKIMIAALSAALARKWSDVVCHTVDPGWVPTQMGGQNAPDSLDDGSRTQAWLAVTDDADARVSGGYWHQMRRVPHEPEIDDPQWQDALLARLAAMTGMAAS